MMPLELLSPGERGEIIAIRQCGNCGCHDSGHGRGDAMPHHHKATATRAEEMGLRVGKHVEVLKNDGSLLLLLVDEARIAIDRKIARTISVKGVAA